MILLPRSWRLSTVRSVVNGVAWLIVLFGLYGGYRQACGAEGWGAFIIVWLGIFIIALLAATEEGITLPRRGLRLLVGMLMLPFSFFFIASLQEFIRFACPS